MKKAVINRAAVLDYAGTEAVNTICTNLLFAGRMLKKILISSCTASEGKSFMAMQIMQNLARRGRSVVLVDADLRRSYMVKRYDVKLEGDKPHGLAHYLAGYCEAENIIYATNTSGAYIIPAGRDVANPIPLLETPQFSALLDGLAQQFDLVLVDAPPVGLVVDAASMARHCDGVVLVVEYNKTRRRELVEAKRQIDQSGCPILGCVINKVTFESISAKKYYNRSYNSHYNNENRQGTGRAAKG